MKHPLEMSPISAVRLALKQRDFSAPGSLLTEVLVRTAPSDASFWVDVASELHRMGLHLDAYDCWSRAIDIDPDYVDREEMAKSLWEASSGQGYLADEALKAFEAAGSWQDVAYLRFRLGHQKPYVLQAIERALEDCPSSLEWDEYWDFDEFHNIWGWYALAHYYLEKNACVKGIWALGRALAAEPNDAELVRSVSNTLNSHVNLNGKGEA